MVRYINTRENGDATGNGKSFRVGETVFMVAGHGASPVQNRAHGLSLTSLTIPMPFDDAELEPANTYEQDEPIAGETAADNGDGDDQDSAQMSGTELLAPRASAGSLERRLASILPGQPDAIDVGLAAAPPQPINVDSARERPSRARAIALALIMLLVLGSIALTIHFQRQTQRDLTALRTTVQDQQQTAGDLVIEEVRREIRALPVHNPQEALNQAQRNAQAILELKQAVVERTQGTEGQTQQLSEVIRQQLAEQMTEQKHDTASIDQVKEPILTELRELKDALAELQSRPAYAPPPVVAPGAATSVAAVPSATSTPVPATDQDASAMLAQAQLSVASQPADRPGTIYLVDATGGLKNMIPEVLAEVRRLIQHEGASDTPYVLMLYSERLVRVAGLPQSHNGSTERSAPPVVDLGSADLAGAIQIALETRPRAIHLLSDTLAGGMKVADRLKELNREGIRIDATQFHYRDGQDTMKQIAREHNGMYSYIPSSR